MPEEPSGRILIEGGPFWTRTNRLIAVALGAVVGLLVAVVVLFVVAVDAAQDAHRAVHAVQAGRVEAVRQTCEEANMRHVVARAGIERLVQETTPRNRVLAQAAREHVLLEAFVQALVPAYDCEQRVRELTR